MKKEVSIILPTYNERRNLEKLIPAISRQMKDASYEIIVVDDNSQDGTASAAETLGKKFPVRVVVRKKERGLSTAVLRGFGEAEGEIIGVMDADLSHPPEMIPKFIGELKKGSDFVLGSRYAKGGGVEEWPFHRKLVSQVATLLARPITNVKDPMSGFFFFRKKTIEGMKLSPLGYKIGLEIIVKGKVGKIKEVPFVFLNRKVGKSKLDPAVYLQYLLHLLRLYRYKFLGK